MTIAFDKVSNATPGIGNLSWSHVPVGSPRGVVVFVLQYDSGTDQVTGTSYGGVAMTEVSGSPNLKTTSEAMGVYCYFLGSGIPTGTQTVLVGVSGATQKAAVCYTMTAAAGTDTVIKDVDATINSDSLANPSVTLTTGEDFCFCTLGFAAGGVNLAAVDPLTNWTSSYEFDAGAGVVGTYRYNIVASADVTAGWTQAADDAVAITLALAEFGPSPSVSPSVSPSISPSASVSPSVSPSISPSVSPSISPSVSASISPSASVSPSISPSESPSVSPSESPSISQSASISPSISPSASESPSISPSASESPSVSLSESPSESPSVSASESASPSPSGVTYSSSVSPSVSPSISPSGSVSPSASPSPSIGITGAVCWGHDTGVVETPRDFAGNWYGTGTISGSGDAEQICLEAGEYMISEIVETGDMIVELLQNHYAAGDDVVMKYRMGATPTACFEADWIIYTIPFISLGYVQIRLESTI